MITEVRLKKLRNKLPTDWMGWKGFRGNISSSPKFITDGMVLLLSSALLEDMQEKIDEDLLATLIEESRIQTLWHMRTKTPSRLCYFIGCGAWSNADPVAVLSDTKAFIYVDPYKLSFALQAVAADSMEAAKHLPDESPIILFRSGNPVGLVCPMKLKPGQEGLGERYDLNAAAPVPISFALSREK